MGLPIDFSDPRVWLVALYTLMLVGVVTVWVWLRWRRAMPDLVLAVLLLVAVVLALAGLSSGRGS
jgi:hypothetical protein